MPKKTRREKILARTHRLNREFQSLPTRSPPIDTDSRQKQSNPYSYTATQTLKSQKSAVKDSDMNEFVAIRKDLAKTALLATLAIVVEFLLYLQTGKT